jgi:glycosyltransferase involved in cell wall biosynthesis
MHKIIIATIMRPAGETGVQTHFNCFQDYLVKQQIDHHLVTPFSYYKAVVYPLFAVRSILKKFSGELSVMWYRYWHAYFLKCALKQILKNNEKCVIYAQCPLSANAALQARVYNTQKVVLVIHFNVSQADEWAEKKLIKIGGRFYNAIERFEACILPKLDGLIFVSKFMQQELERRIPAINQIPSAVIPNFLPDPGIPETIAPTADLINIGTLEPRKNQQYLLEIIAALRQQDKPKTLTIVGDGPDRELLEEKARALGIEDLVEFSGFIKNAAQLINHHKAYIHVAKMESFGITLIEALAHSRPIFAPSVGGIPEILNNESTGVTLPLNDPIKAAEIINHFLNDPHWMSSTSQSARKQFLQKFCSDTVAEKLIMFFKSI